MLPHNIDIVKFQNIIFYFIFSVGLFSLEKFLQPLCWFCQRHGPKYAHVYSEGAPSADALVRRFRIIDWLVQMIREKNEWHAAAKPKAFVMNMMKLGTYNWEVGASSGAVGWSTALLTVRSQVRFPVAALEFFIDLILSAPLWPWGRVSLNRNECPGIFSVEGWWGGVKATGA